MIYSDVSPGPCCWFYLVCSVEPMGPAPAIVQEAVGGDVASLEFFEPSDIVTNWTVPLWLAHGNASELTTMASLWRATRQRREGRFLSLEEINSAWENSNG